MREQCQVVRLEQTESVRPGMAGFRKGVEAVRRWRDPEPFLQQNCERAIRFCRDRRKIDMRDLRCPR